MSLEYTAQRLRDVLSERDAWLNSKNLPLDTVMDENLRRRFLQSAKDAFNAQPRSRWLERRDFQEMRNPKLVKAQIR